MIPDNGDSRKETSSSFGLGGILVDDQHPNRYCEVR